MSGRLVTCVIGIFGVWCTTLMQAILTNQLKLTKVETYIMEYVHLPLAQRQFRHCAATLIQRSFRLKRWHRVHSFMRYQDGTPPPSGLFHRVNMLFHAMKELRVARMEMVTARTMSHDHVLEDEVVSVTEAAEEMGLDMQNQQDSLLEFNRKVLRRLVTDLRPAVRRSLPRRGRRRAGSATAHARAQELRLQMEQRVADLQHDLETSEGRPDVREQDRLQLRRDISAAREQLMQLAGAKAPERREVRAGARGKGDAVISAGSVARLAAQSVAKSLEEQRSKMCANCGNKLMDDAVFCRKCGTATGRRRADGSAPAR